MKYIEERFGFKGCTGCGRCINVCPAFIDIIEVASKLKQEYKHDIEEMKQNNAAAAKFEIHTHDLEHSCENMYKPQIAVIKDIIQETRDIKRFIIQYEDKALHENYKFTGQFFEITIFGVGEIAISIPFGPSQKDYFDFCIKKAGHVTAAIHELKVGDKVGLRGPFGKGFPYEELKGRDILIVGSGVGLAPVRTMIVRIIENKRDFGKLGVIASATTYEGLVYKEDLKKWSEIDGVKVQYALSKPTEKVDAYVGYINDLLPDLGLDWGKTTAIICASPKRIKAVAKDLIRLGMKGTDILTSLQTHMRCGIGKCGHCKVGNKYMCVDGPVFYYEEMLTLPPEF
jgi:NAD(P)H-flavin reductase